MDSLPHPEPSRNPHYPRVDHEGTVIDYRDDPTGWATMPRISRRVPLPPVPPTVDPHDITFLDDAGDFTSPSPRYDAVFERPIGPGDRVEVTVLDGGHATVVGKFRSLQDANDAMYRTGTMMFGVKIVQEARNAS
jgi:hypothetical protein